MLYVRIQNNIVMELFSEPPGFTLQECFTPEIARQFVPVAPGLIPEQGFLYSNGVFSPPDPIPTT